MARRWIAAFTAIFATILIFASCGAPSVRPQGDDLDGRILLWYYWSEVEGEALNQAISAFTNLHPDVVIKTQRFESRAEMETQYKSAVTAGLGPDVLILPVDDLLGLVGLNSIDPVDQYIDEDIRARYSDSVFELVRYNDQTYGFPLVLDTMALYYNNARVDAPINTLNGLVDQASRDTNVLLPTNFYDAVWGIHAFGGKLFNDEGMSILDEGGFANWLAWLSESRSAPGMIQDTNRDVLLQRFIAGEAGYYFGYARELNQIREALGPDHVGVLTLPAGPIAGASPFLSAEAFFFSTVSSDNQREIVAELAKFISNSEQSARLMRLANFVPANQRVRINARLNPIVATFAVQARAAVPRPVDTQFQHLLELGNEAYARALESDESPVDIALSLTNAVNEANGFPTQAEPSYACTDIGTIRLMTTWEDDAADALQQILERFKNVCPLIIVQVVPAESNDMRTALGDGAGQRATIALVDQPMLLHLTSDEPVITNLTPLVAADTLQRFWPSGLEAMRVQGNLFGLPLALDTNALYYNRDLVATPAQVVEDLRIQAAEGVPITLDTRFERAFWGVGAFGDRLFDDQYHIALGEGFVFWLNWLKESRDSSGIKLTNDGDALLDAFLNRETAYYVGGPSELAQLQDALGPSLGVTTLPHGPAGSASPFVRASGFVVRTSVDENLTALVRQTVRFASDVESQALLMNEAHLIPANATVTYSDDSPFAVFTTQVQSGYVVPNTTAMVAVQRYGDSAYTAVLEEGRDAAEVVAELAARIDEANGIAPPPEPTTTADAASETTTPTTTASPSVDGASASNTTQEPMATVEPTGEPTTPASP